MVGKMGALAVLCPASPWVGGGGGAWAAPLSAGGAPHARSVSDSIAHFLIGDESPFVHNHPGIHLVQVPCTFPLGLFVG